MPNNIKFNIDLIIEEYTPYLYKVLNNLTTSLTPEDKEEIISDAFYLLWKNQANIKTNLKSYLAQIAKNCTYQKLKQTNYHQELNEEILSTPNTSHLDDLLIMKDALAKLTTNEQNLFHLYYIEGYPVKDLAKLLNKSISNIKVSLYRLRKKLKEANHD